jgi:type II secretory pathway component PulF
MERDGQAIIAHLQAGQSLDTTPALSRIPASIAPAMALATQHGNLPQVLSALSRQFERQAEQRISLIPAVLIPVLVLIIGLCAGGILYGLWMPLAGLIKGMTG